MQTPPRDPLSELTERQQELLELIADNVTTSKALSRHTGLKPRSIDTTLTNALKILGVPNRREAAVRYLELKENSQLPPQLTILDFGNPEDSATSDDTGTDQGSPARTRRFFRRVPLGGEKHSLRWDQITLEVLRVAFVGMVALTVLVVFVLGFLRAFG